MPAKTTTITGISGFVGGSLARVLLSQGYRVRGLIHRDRRAVEGLNVQLLEGDLLDPPSLEKAFTGSAVVYHLAASISLTGSWSQMEAVNVVGTRNVVQACLACGVDRLVHCSSIHAFEQVPLDVPLDETRPLASDRHHPAYDRSKALGEMEVRKGLDLGLDAIILNPTAISGPLDFKPSYFGKALIAFAEGRIPALVKGGFDWVDVRDVVSAMVRAEQGASRGAQYLLSGHWHSVAEISRLVAGLTQAESPKIKVPLWLAYLGLPVINLMSRINHTDKLYTRFSLQALKSNRHISHSRAAQDLGYHPRPFEETIREAVCWFQENGYLGKTGA
jgi:dihydroflavonol-4-reductase